MIHLFIVLYIFIIIYKNFTRLKLFGVTSCKSGGGIRLKIKQDALKLIMIKKTSQVI